MTHSQQTFDVALVRSGNLHEFAGAFLRSARTFEHVIESTADAVLLCHAKPGARILVMSSPFNSAKAIAKAANSGADLMVVADINRLVDLAEFKVPSIRTETNVIPREALEAIVLDDTRWARSIHRYFTRTGYATDGTFLRDEDTAFVRGFEMEVGADFNAGMLALVQRLVDDDTMLLFDKLVGQGRVIAHSNRMQADKLASFAGIRVVFCGHDAYIVAHGATGAVDHAKAAAEYADIGISVRSNLNSDTTRFTFFCENPDIDLKPLARRVNGGGSANMAGTEVFGSLPVITKGCDLDRVILRIQNAQKRVSMTL